MNTSGYPIRIRKGAHIASVIPIDNDIWFIGSDYEDNSQCSSEFTNGIHSMNSLNSSILNEHYTCENLGIKFDNKICPLKKNKVLQTYWI